MARNKMFDILKSYDDTGTQDLLPRKRLCESVFELFKEHDLFSGVTVYMMLFS